MARTIRQGVSHCQEIIVIFYPEQRTIECDLELFHKGKHQAFLHDSRDGMEGTAVLKWKTIKKATHYDFY